MERDDQGAQDDATDWRVQGQALMNEKRFEEALEVYERALREAPDDTHVLVWKLDALQKLGRHDEALISLDTYLSRHPDDEAMWVIRANILLAVRRGEDALSALDRAVQIAPGKLDIPFVWVVRGDVYRALGRIEDAISAYQRAIELDPDEAPVWNQLGRQLLNLERREEALAALDHALTLDPTHLSASKNRAATLFQLQRNEEALAAYNRVLEIKPDDAGTWHWKGVTLRRLSRQEDALAAFDQALILDSTMLDALKGRANSLFALKRYNDALAAYDRALEIKPEDRDAWYWKGAALGNLGREDEALASLDHALALGLDTYFVHRSRARSLGALQRYEEALAETGLALARDPNGYDAWCDRGVALAGQKRFEEALAAYERAHALKPDEASSLRGIGVMLGTLGRYEEALAAFDSALERAPDNAAVRAARGMVAARITRAVPDQRLLLSGGRTLGYLDFGDPDGFPIFYFHGTPGSRLELVTFDLLLKELHIRLITPERPGYGLSTDQPRRAILDWPDDVVALADHLGIAHFAVIGASGGGPYAAACAYKLPERVRALGLVSSVAPPEAVRGKSALAPWYISWWVARHSPMSLIRLNSASLARSVLDNLGFYAEAWKRRDEGTLLALFVPNKRRRPQQMPTAGPAPVDREIMTEPYQQNGRGHARDGWLQSRAWGLALDHIAVPTYLWHGENDLMAPVFMGRYLAATIPNCQATYYPGERHNLQNHMREIFTALLAASGVGAGEREEEPGAAI